MPSTIAAFIYRTRVLYFFLPLLVSVAVKRSAGQTTPLPLFIAGSTVALAAQAFRMYAASFLRGRHVVTAPEADFLCTSGPYVYVRNPLYLGNLLIGLAICVTINEWYAYALFLAGFAIAYSIVIPYEEAFLAAKFGEVYAAYSKATPRFFPRRKPDKSNTHTQPDYRAGILGEVHVPILLIALEAVIYQLFVA